MFGENAERRSAAPISSATEWKIFLNISSRVGSTFGARKACSRESRLPVARMCPRLCWLGQQDLAIAIDSGPPACRNQRRRAVLRNHSGAREGITAAQLFAID